MDIPPLEKPYTQLDWPEVETRLQVARANFLDTDRKLLDLKVGERAMAFRYAVYLDHLFPEWDVDCEYNLDGDKPKRLKRSAVVGHIRTPDIVVHHRGYQCNLIIFEVKRSKNKANDTLKLESWQREYNYRYTVAMRFIYKVNEVHIALSEYDNLGSKVYSTELGSLDGGPYMVPRSPIGRDVGIK